MPGYASVGTSLRNVARCSQNDVAKLRQQRSAARCRSAGIVGHHQHVVEESVDRGPEARQLGERRPVVARCRSAAAIARPARIAVRRAAPSPPARAAAPRSAASARALSVACSSLRDVLDALERRRQLLELRRAARTRRAPRACAARRAAPASSSGRRTAADVRRSKPALLEQMLQPLAPEARAASSAAGLGPSATRRSAAAASSSGSERPARARRPVSAGRSTQDPDDALRRAAQPVRDRAIRSASRRPRTGRRSCPACRRATRPPT